LSLEYHKGELLRVWLLVGVGLLLIVSSYVLVHVGVSEPWPLIPAYVGIFLLVMIGLAYVFYKVRKARQS